MDTLRRYLSQALRRIWRHPVYSLTILACLTLGIGANSAIFSVLNNFLLRELPVREVDEVAFVVALREGTDPFEASYLEYLAMRDQAASFSGVGLSRPSSFALTGGDQPERLAAASITPDYLSTLGVEPAVGRAFTAEEFRPDGERVALLGHALWQRRFAGVPSVVGERLLLDGEPYSVVGVLPPAFDLPLSTEVWVPLALELETLPLRQQAAPANLAVARLAPGVTLAAANTELAGLAERLAEAHPDFRQGWTTKVIPLRQQLLGDINGDLRPKLVLVAAVAGLLLLIACVNIASLLLIRALERGHEVAVQTALGAGRRGLAGQLLVESGVLALLGGAAGLLVAFWATPSLLALNPVRPYALGEVFSRGGLDGRVLGFTLAVAVVTGLLFGLVPALRVSLTAGVLDQLKEGAGRASGSRGGRRVLAALVVGEIAVATVLLIGAGLTVRSFLELQQTDLGFSPQRKLVLELSLSRARYGEHHQQAALIRELVTRMGRLPGVVAVGTTTTIPLATDSYDAPYMVEGQAPVQDAEVPVTANRYVSPGYLEMMGVRQLAGRLLSEEDQPEGQRAVVVSADLVRRAWPGQSFSEVLGNRLRVGVSPDNAGPWMTVVGVVADVQEDRFNFGVARPVWYLSQLQVSTRISTLNVVLETSGDPRALAAAARRVVGEVDPEQPVARLTTLEEHLAEFKGPYRFSLILISVFALVGLLLAVLGLYGVISYAVAQDRQQLGIRLALGALPRDLVLLSLGRGLRLIVLGLVVGLGGGWLLSTVLASRFEQLAGVNRGLLLSIAGILLLAALVAVYLPSRRTARIDPTVVLRYE
jgi:predicted permease